ncbi:efflux RND transporter periplasmic adaptor subunit [Megasphaera vaginalis (ex Srinivasan et al. 2021)]|uniref:HlyD family secretion protein n=1 Tax=Megasphaera vaginalis (ex Srinivasan et al. 2021) TaxID=1111454 RepID=U7UEJ6_9FIRM|nr:efflux RND transporter periplasmic adaptor subunit [Megasphaera vaginalis (ex Srinivasan et al. 2021)]ERT57775.1 HlyD family secretion protein [Megasphaera vaginalis (ex Srinivasan et al. 2021)]
MKEKLLAHKKTLLLLAIVLLAALGYYAYTAAQKDDPALVLYGNVDIRQVSLAFNSSERIEEMYVDEGDRVKKGDVLAKLATQPLELQIAAMEAQIAQQEAVVNKLHNGSRPQELAGAQASTASAQADADNAAATYTRLLTLYNQDAVSKQELDNGEARYKAAMANLQNAQAAQNLTAIGPRSEDIAAAEAQLQQLQEQLKLQKCNLSQTTLTAPQDGVIRSRLLETGDMATPQKPVFTLSPDSAKWIRAYVSENRLGELYEGKQAFIHIDSFPDRKIIGQVGYISNTAEFTPKTVQTEDLRSALLYEVRIYVTDEDNILRMGMPATITF